MDGSNLSNSPKNNEAEISVFGPGYGESIVVHLGLGEWLIADSCIDRDSKLPASIEYLRTIGVDPSTAVKLVVATHWHDDHMRGIESVFQECRSAKFICSASLRTDEFLTLVEALGKRSLMTDSGVDEFFKIIKLLKERAQSGRPQSKGPEWAMADRRLWQREGPEFPGEVYALSPSSGSITLAYNEIAQLLPVPQETKKQAVALGANHVAVVLWIRISYMCILLGSDLEETADPATGWSVIVDSSARPRGKACVFKIPHHGSQNADQPRVWSEMLSDDPYAVLTPFTHGDINLPTRGDSGRICRRTPNAYSTARPILSQTRRRHGVVAKTIKDTVRRIRVITGPTGHVRLRRNLRSGGDGKWNVELFNGALHLRRIYS